MCRAAVSLRYSDPMSDARFTLAALPPIADDGEFHPLYAALHELSVEDSRRVFGTRDHAVSAERFAAETRDEDTPFLDIVALVDPAGVRAEELPGVNARLLENNPEEPEGLEENGCSTVAASLSIGFPALENLTRAYLTVTVAEEFRESGLFAALLDVGEKIARDRGRYEYVYWLPYGTWVGDDVAHPSPDNTGQESVGDAVEECAAPEPGNGRIVHPVRTPETRALEQHGYHPEIHEWCMVFEVIDDLPEPQHVAGYEVETWHSPYSPEESLAELAAIFARASTDMPGADNDEPEVWDADRVRSKEALYERMNSEWITSVVRPTGGEIVGWSTLYLSRATPEAAQQSGTLVRTDHRGHGLATWMKRTNVHELRKSYPEVRRITTENEGNNTPVLAMNLRMGFRPVALSVRWDKSTAGQI